MEARPIVMAVVICGGEQISEQRESTPYMGLKWELIPIRNKKN